MGLFDKLLGSKDENEMIIPTGLTFKFLVKPNLTKKDQEALKQGLVKMSGLSEYYNIRDIGYFKDFEDNQMLVKVFCPEATVAIEKSKEEKFYSQLVDNFSQWVIDTLKKNGYVSHLYDFSHTVRLSP